MTTVKMQVNKWILRLFPSYLCGFFLEILIFKMLILYQKMTIRK